MDIPVWIYFIVSGIIISALMAVKTGKEERIEEVANIEKEGEVYIKRMEEEKEKREKTKTVGYKEMGSN